MDSFVQRIQLALQQLKRNLESDSLNSLEITRPQMFMLYTIRQSGACKLTQLAEKLEVKPSAITVMIDRLEKSGYVRRTHDRADRRSILVEITPAGIESLERAVKVRNQILSNYLSRLNPAEIATLAELLEKVAPGIMENEA